MKNRYVLVPVLLARAAAQSPLPGTAPLTTPGDLAAQMVDGINDYLVRRSAAAPASRAKYWRRDFSSAAAYSRSIEPNREHLARIIGAVDPPLQVKALEFESSTAAAAFVGRGRGYRVEAVRWPVWEGVFAEGLLLEPDRPPVARVVALPDADWSPEALAGLSSGIPVAAQFARRLAENGCEVLVPVVLNRQDTWSGIPGVKMTNQPHREWIYRMAFEVGRHVIGYEIQKVRAAIGWFAGEREPSPPCRRRGYGEGGLLALYSAALDTRIDATLVSGYFQPREQLWKEPVYRDVWGLLREFGDAEIASMISPRALVVEASGVPQVSGPPKESQDRSGATPNGRLATPSLAEVRAEVDRARPFFQGLHFPQNCRWSRVPEAMAGRAPMRHFRFAHRSRRKEKSSHPPNRPKTWGCGRSLRPHASAIRSTGQPHAGIHPAVAARRERFWARQTHLRRKGGNPAPNFTGTTSGAR